MVQLGIHLTDMKENSYALIFYGATRFDQPETRANITRALSIYPLSGILELSWIFMKRTFVT